jgi:hypothetical protein
MAARWDVGLCASVGRPESKWVYPWGSGHGFFFSWGAGHSNASLLSVRWRVWLLFLFSWGVGHSDLCRSPLDVSERDPQSGNSDARRADKRNRKTLPSLVLTQRPIPPPLVYSTTLAASCRLLPWSPVAVSAWPTSLPHLSASPGHHLGSALASQPRKPCRRLSPSLSVWHLGPCTVSLTSGS